MEGFIDFTTHTSVWGHELALRFFSNQIIIIITRGIVLALLKDEWTPKHAARPVNMTEVSSSREGTSCLFTSLQLIVNAQPGLWVCGQFY